MSTVSSPLIISLLVGNLMNPSRLHRSLMGRRSCSTFWFRSRVRGDEEISDHMYDDAMNENVVDELVSYDDSVRW